MQTYAYTAVDRSGRNVAGQAMADDETSLEAKLQASGLWLMEARPELPAGKPGPGRPRFFRSVSRRELISFCILMNFQLKVGISMVTAIQLAADDCANPKFRVIIEALKTELEGGQSLCEAMEKFPGHFPKNFTSLVRAGEASGTLPDSFEELRRYLEWQDQIIADVRQATIYPAIVLGVVIIFVLLLFTFVIPRFVTLLTSINVPLPWPTRFIFGVSHFATSTWWMWLLAGIFGPVGIVLGKRYSPRFAIAYDKVKFRLPLFGDLNHMLAISRFAQNLAVLYRSGVNIVNALKLTEGLVGSPWVASVIQDVGQHVKEGDAISDSMRRHAVLPGLLVRMVVMGEKTGNLDKALENVAAFYNLVVPRKIKKIFSVAEPALILFLVVVVGFVALSIFLPILSLLGAIH